MADFPNLGRVGMHVVDERTAEVLADADSAAPFDSASMIKLALLAVLLDECRAGRSTLDAPLEILETDRARGDGILREWALPLRLPVGDLATTMIVLSDNTATNAILRALGIETVNARLHEWSFAVTRSHGPVAAPDAPRRSIGVTSAREVARLIQGLLAGTYGGTMHRDWTRGVLERQQDERAMSRYLDRAARCAHKTGTAETWRHDGGTLLDGDGRPLVCAVFLTEGLGPAVERHDHPAVLAIARATVRLVRELSLPVPLVPWAPVT